MIHNIFEWKKNTCYYPNKKINIIMSSLFIELEPNEKLFIELVEFIILDDFINKIKNYIISLHIYINDSYYFLNLNEEKNTNFKGIKLPKNTKIILENQNKISKFMIDTNIIIKDVNMIEEKEYKNDSSKEIINWNAKEIKQ